MLELQNKRPRLVRWLAVRPSPKGVEAFRPEVVVSYARETTLIVFERSALQRVERGVPVLRPGWILPLTYGRRKEWRSNATTTNLKLREVFESVKLNAVVQPRALADSCNASCADLASLSDKYDAVHPVEGLTRKVP